MARAVPSLIRVMAPATLFVAAAAWPIPASAEALGIGPRFSFIRATADTDASTRFSGGVLRAYTSPRTALEIALDYHSVINDDLTQRIRDFPVQGSILGYLGRAAVAPYVLAGVGWYSQRVEGLGANKVVTSSATTRRVGYHAGAGGQIKLGQRAAVFVDYRYTFIHFGKPEDGIKTDPGAIPIPGTISLQDKLKLSHEGSMWTTGFTFNF